MKAGDIVYYVGGNSEWKKAKYKFEVIKFISHNEVKVKVLESISEPFYKKGDVLYFKTEALKILNRTQSKPEWF